MRSAMRAASQLSGRGPLMWMLPLCLHVNKKSDYDMTSIKWAVIYFLTRRSSGVVIMSRLLKAISRTHLVLCADKRFVCFFIALGKLVRCKFKTG